MSEYIYNPATGRNVLRSGKIGKRLIKEQEYADQESEPESDQESEPSCNICTEEYNVKKCRRCNYHACNSCMRKWYRQIDSKSCPGCRHNFITGAPIRNLADILPDIDFSHGLTVFADRLIANPPRNGHIMEDIGDLIKRMAIEHISDPNNVRNLIDRFLN
jgi:hypothetical protein